MTGKKDQEQEREEDAAMEFWRDPEFRREQLEYRKWIVGLSTFVLTVSLSAGVAFSPGLGYKWLLVPGWMALCLCIFLNWLLVKGIISAAIVNRVPEEQRNWLHRTFEHSIQGRFDSYAFWQNLLFLLGVPLIAGGLLANVAGLVVTVLATIACILVIRVIVRMR